MKAGILSAVCLATCLALAGLPAVALAQAEPSTPAASEPSATDAKPADAAPAAEQRWAVHGQTTVVEQGSFAFRSPYRGTNSLDPSARGRETFDATLYAGLRPWAGAEIWVNQEVDQGFGLSGTLGAAGFPSGEAYKVGNSDPYMRLQRAFFRQTINLGGERQNVDPDLNQLGGSRTANRLVFTVGKFSVGDVFDANKYAHDPRGDFLNWSIVDTGSFDYAADAWGYTAGAAVEWYRGRWTARAAVFDLSVVPNSTTLDGRLSQFQLIGELEERHKFRGRDGKIAITAFLSRGRMAKFADALAAAGGGVPDVASVRHYATRTGIGVNLEQQLTDHLGLFVRAGVADGNYEPYEFADIDRTLAVGLSLSGGRWGRKDDTVGVAGVANAISKIHQQYFAAGGLGILVGDGQLPHYGAERIVEAYYSAAVMKDVKVSLDGQVLGNLAYNRDRGPATVFAVRLHAQF
jgi:high affinity Mn2+ porin